MNHESGTRRRHKPPTRNLARGTPSTDRSDAPSDAPPTNALLRWLASFVLLVGLLVAAILWTQWPEIAVAVQEMSVDEGLVALIGLCVGPILFLGIARYLLRLYFYITGSKRAANTRRLVETLKRDGQAAWACDTCGGIGRHGSSVFLWRGRTLLIRSACKECRGTGMMRDCRACGYNLTGNVSGVCPECGTPCKPDASET